MESPKLLDVGCGKGFFIESCVRNDINAEGIDVSKSGIDFAINKLKVKAFQTDIAEFVQQKENQNKYDVVTLWATIEHLLNPYQVIGSIFQCLKPGGLFFLDTGLGNDRWEKYLCGHSQWFDAPQHLFVYSIDGLKILLTKAGFKIIKINKNFERNYLRRIIKFMRHFVICFGSFVMLRPVLGKTGFEVMQKESKWPIGKLLQIIAKKI
ncbi:MAG: class I SAM-dependent methyltransferase [Ignavibacteriaceae bacterium]|nr:class I SAM-dependent methyltransferase [Ignavibacteriaceae bacterium]